MGWWWKICRKIHFLWGRQHLKPLLEVLIHKASLRFVYGCFCQLKDFSGILFPSYTTGRIHVNQRYEWGLDKRRKVTWSFSHVFDSRTQSFSSHSPPVKKQLYINFWKRWKPFRTAHSSIPYHTVAMNRKVAARSNLPYCVESSQHA